MFLSTFEVDPKSLVADIVSRDYRTAAVFRKYGIGYCCGGKWPLDIACEMNGVDYPQLVSDLAAATRRFGVSGQPDFAGWDIDFLIDYIINVHHRYLKKAASPTRELLGEFTDEHLKKFSWLPELGKQYDRLVVQLEEAMQREEDVLFPYIRQIAHAHEDRESYAALLVRTLRKPVADTINRTNDPVEGILASIRQLTGNYSIPANACTSNKVVIAKLQEMDTDISQHYYLEQNVLFPRALAIEKEILNG